MVHQSLYMCFDSHVMTVTFESEREMYAWNAAVRVLKQTAVQLFGERGDAGPPPREEIMEWLSEVRTFRDVIGERRVPVDIISAATFQEKELGVPEHERIFPEYTGDLEMDLQHFRHQSTQG